MVWVLCAAALALAGNESGKGGNGVIRGGRPFLLDFAEFGTADAPLIDDSMRRHPSFAIVRKRIEGPLRRVLKGAEIDAVAEKLLEVGLYYPSLAYKLMETIPQ